VGATLVAPQQGRKAVYGGALTEMMELHRPRRHRAPPPSGGRCCKDSARQGQRGHGLVQVEGGGAGRGVCAWSEGGRPGARARSGAIGLMTFGGPTGPP
jgi:hypothetical protein